MTSLQSQLGGGSDAGATAEELAEGQRSISIAEFFEKNKQMLGFDSDAKALVTAVKEGVDNALDATEEAGFLPDIYVEIEDRGDYYRLVVEDNGPGITKDEVPKVFGKLLYGSRFHAREQARGQQGIGISAAVLYAQLTSGKPAKITSKTENGDGARYFELTIDTDSNEPEIDVDESASWERPHGTRIELEMEANMRARRQLHDYIQYTAVVNPHARIEFHEPGDAEKFERAAYDHTETLYEQMPRDWMFCGMNFDYAGFLGYDQTGDRDLYAVGLAGADAMVDMFDETARQVRVGEHRIKGPEEQFDMEQEVKGRPSGDNVAVLDTIHTSLPVLWRAYRETGTTRFRDVALAHADRHVDWYLHDDGKNTHMAMYDPETGEVEQFFDTLAYEEDTCWARGQGWNIAGLSRAYSETGARRYLDRLETAVDYYLEQTPDDLVPYWDFEDPRIPEVPRDTSCAGISAYGLTRLFGDDDRVERLRSVGEDILASMISDYLLTDVDDGRRGMVLHGCYNMPGDYATDNELIWRKNSESASGSSGTRRVP